jgi:hypothetical protein
MDVSPIKIKGAQVQQIKGDEEEDAEISDDDTSPI